MEPELKELELKGYVKPGFEEAGEAFLNNFHELDDLGASAALFIDQEKVIDIWAGVMNENVPEVREWQEDTLVNVWSTTKGFASLAIHMLRARGQLDFDKPVAYYWEEFAANGKAEIPVLYLLNHRSGMVSWKKRFTRSKGPEILYNWDEAVSLLAEQEPFWEPGTASGYHLLSYGHLVGELLRRIDGRPIDQFIKEEITVPLGLDFHMPLAESDFHRVADLRLMPNLNTFSEASKTKLSTMAQFAFTNPLARITDACSAEWRKAVIPAANGHCGARAVAKLYGILATGGTAKSENVTLLSPEDIEEIREPSEPGVDLILGAGMAGAELVWGRGYRIDHDNSYGPNPRAFYHWGFGGSLGYCDPESKIGFSYVMNRIELSSKSGQRSGNILKAIYNCID